jgi:branched-chain amino acid transport system ATP-binding protein
MALKISHRAYALSLGRVEITGHSADLRDDDRIRALYLGGEL